MYVYIYIYIYINMYIYTYIEREREREREVCGSVGPGRPQEPAQDGVVFSFTSHKRGVVLGGIWYSHFDRKAKGKVSHVIRKFAACLAP